MSGGNELALRHERLRQRAAMLARLRGFFAERGFLEVETPVVDAEIIPELHIEPFGVGDASHKQAFGFLQASPELHMKRLLCEGLPAIFQVTRSFRYGERGAIHNPEFTMVEWYRTGDGMAAGMQLLDELCQAVAGSSVATRTTYAEAFRTHAGVDAHHANCAELAAAAKRLHVAVPEGIHADDRDEWLNLLLADVVEPRLGADWPEILYDYPATQSALAVTATRADGTLVGERFELYWHGIELANGYHELTDAAALRTRLEEVNRQRSADNRPALPLPERLLAAMADPGLPACSGCALGFDRLAMLAGGATTIDDVMAFTW
ncbi:EF-P lysine aminoacylase EpmA [Lacipirellula parvula]|uniref:Translation elongation factor P n=1 Tax=Lacipirellula parvula TaxID=2650471 RepID=A0A5K7XJ68_9BACT|nr:EF-P lysine aminoacylase EpmA [Lacipirellula parvula]BBO36137.1 translation elongation factor P [Lacipirellula parvula]